jgi:hypothetical protein
MHTAVFAFLLFTGLMQSAAPPPQPRNPVESSPTQAPATVKASDSSEDLNQKLLQVRRIFVDSFGDDTVAKQVQAMIITSLAGAKKFVVTENKEKADATLKGTGLEKTSQEVHSYKEGTAAGGVGGSFSGGSGAVVGHAAAIEDASTSTETIHEARVAVRLVDRDGDVIWSSTQESKGGKYKGASADVADKVVRQLLRDLEKAEKKREQPPVPARPS